MVKVESANNANMLDHISWYFELDPILRGTGVPYNVLMKCAHEMFGLGSHQAGVHL